MDDRGATGRLGRTSLVVVPPVIAVAAAVLAIAGVLGGTATAASGTGPRSHSAAACRGHLLAKTTGGSLTEEIVFHGQGPETENIFLCSSSGGRRFAFPEGPLGYAYSFLFSGLTFAGSQAAALAFAWGASGTPELWVVDLSTDRVIYKKVLPRDVADPETIEVARIVLQRDGSVAWTELSASGSCEVVEHTSHGTKVLDNTHKAEPTSLKLVGSTLHWLEQDGEARTATLR